MAMGSLRGKAGMWTDRVVKTMTKHGSVTKVVTGQPDPRGLTSQEAVMEVRVLKEAAHHLSGKQSLVAVRLHTGRKHQVRLIARRKSSHHPLESTTHQSV